MVKYLVRLDDACPTMDREKWNIFIDFFKEHSIKPIIAVVPDNKDTDLVASVYDENFWSNVRHWDNLGFDIALHGYNHDLMTDYPGILGLNKYSEFAGLSYYNQGEKLRKAIGIFNKEKIKTRCWVAPAHSFDGDTIRALLSETDINIISDGLSFRPYTDQGCIWVPQQLWKFKSRKNGIYTICYHPNNMSIASIQTEINKLKQNLKKISNIDDVLNSSSIKRRSLLDFNYHYFFLAKRYV
ncbi:DUF2334 domain-containing protein, partial [Vibrio splendidus]